MHVGHGATAKSLHSTMMMVVFPCNIRFQEILEYHHFSTMISISGEVGSVLNYPECVVYNESACIPKYLIVYSPPQ